MREPICSFCDANAPKRRLLEGPGVFVCLDCVSKILAEMLRAGSEGHVVETSDTAKRWCSFCGKERHEVTCMAVRGNHSLCSECALLSVDVFFPKGSNGQLIHFDPTDA